MGYIQDVERDFRALIEEILPVLPDDTEATLVSFVKVKVLESYRNGMEATRKAPAPIGAFRLLGSGSPTFRAAGSSPRAGSGPSYLEHQPTYPHYPHGGTLGWRVFP